MGDWIDPAVRALESAPTILEALEARWPWAVILVAAVLAVLYGLAPLVRAWRGRS